MDKVVRRERLGDSLGLAIGDSLGLALGFPEGEELGRTLGNTEGAPEGTADTDGVVLGDDDLLGDSLGFALVDGDTLGFPEGEELGAADNEGGADGNKLGRSLGRSLGWTDGGSVGIISEGVFRPSINASKKLTTSCSVGASSSTGSASQ